MDTFKNTLLIANPVAQSGKGAQAALKAADILRASFCDGQNLELFMTEAPGHAREFLSKQSSSYSCVLALGGDGIVHEAVNGLMADSRGCRALGVIPVGSGNDYAKALKMSEDFELAIGQILERNTVCADLGCCNGEYFTETLSFGLDAAIALGTVERRKRSGKHGTILYLEEGIHQLLNHLDTYEFHMELTEGDGPGCRSLDGKSILIAVQNGYSYGGGFAICPEASLSDGLFDICIANGPVSIPHATFVFLRAKNGHHVKSRFVEFHRASHVALSFDRPIPCQIDGEPLQARTYEISMRPSALDVFCGLGA